MPRIKINRKTLKQNDLEIALLRLREYIRTNPLKIIIPIGIAIIIIIFGVATVRYFQRQSSTASLQLLQTQLEFQNALAATDRSAQIVGLNRSLESFQRLSEDYSFIHVGKIAQAYIGNCYYHLGRYEDAIQAYQLVLSRRIPKLLAASVQMSIGYSYLNKGEFQSALNTFEKVITNYPDSHLVPAANLQMAICYERLDNIPKAKEIYEKLVKTYPNTTWEEEAEARLTALTGIEIISPAG